MEEYQLNEEDMFFCKQAISDLDSDDNGEISIHDLETVMERISVYYGQFELYPQYTGFISFQDIFEIYRQKRQNQVYGHNQQATLDAYTAIGGPSNKSGHIDGQVLVRIIKQQFRLPIDIQKLIREVDDSGNGQIQYQQFRNMLQNGRNEHHK